MAFFTKSDERTVLHSSYAGGPHGVGDPDDRRLRKVEMEILIPKKMRDRTKLEKCVAEVEAFSKCCKDTGLAMVVKCRAENAGLKACQLKWFADEAFKKECIEEYLKERSEFRRTGVAQTMRRANSAIYQRAS